ncbi:PadR family transcriptional regulator (plasmid) [Salinirubellus salinus]|uniref:PadR family transcriptional regulator n=1 Tax=Salinirubellus salinus TaxID=1364945 RepID=A0A9E7R8H9_9EURY|nr:PadR family transcriptional regulator [Salinirubellus salinus]UWM56985.1 PadR family transcriptional regulator [Salinirubellus salinus]UWM57024.1 PadR family transcriptional regulator [Salinirubellus salinus]
MHRKLLPMALLHACGGDQIEGRTRLQKLVFLMEQELDEEAKTALNLPDYNFIPYDYGPFSKALYDDLDSLEEDGLIRVEEEDMADGKVKYTYQLTDDGKSWVDQRLPQDAPNSVRERAEALKSEFNGVLLSDLIDTVYAEYPKYAENSVW